MNVFAHRFRFSFDIAAREYTPAAENIVAGDEALSSKGRDLASAEDLGSGARLERREALRAAKGPAVRRLMQAAQSISVPSRYSSVTYETFMEFDENVPSADANNTAALRAKFLDATSRALGKCSAQRV